MLSLKQRFKNWSAVFFTVLLASSPALAASIQLTDFNGNQATVVGQGFENDRQRSYQVNVYVNGNFVADINTNSNGSFSYTTPSGSVSRGDRLSVKVLNWSGSGNHYERSFTLSGGGGGGNPRPEPDYPPAPPPFDMSDYEIRDYADQQARTVANRVTATFGELENWKYNFVMGYWAGIHAYPVSSHTSEYRSGESWGRANGASDGRAAGAGHGSELAFGHGSGTADARFKEIINTGREPNLSVPSVSVPNFGGLTTDANRCSSANGIMDSLDAQLANEMRQLSWRDGDFVLTYDSYSELYSLRIREIYGWGADKYDFVDSWAREEYAWDEWHYNRLRGRYDQNNYNRLQPHRQAYFREWFKAIYDSVIDEKFTRVKTRTNYAARARGEWYGVQIAQKLNYDAGCKAGYANEYTAASVGGFRSGYTQSQFNAGFARTSSHYQNNALVSIGDLSLVDENQNGVFELGEEIGIVVGTVANAGRKDANNLPIRMSGAAVQTLNHSHTVTVAKSTSKALNYVAKSLAKVKLDVIADQANVVSVKIGASDHTLSFTVSWQSALQGLATARPGDAGTAALKDFVLKNIKDEYTKAEASENNLYSVKNGPQPSKLRTLVDFYKSLPANQREVIKSMAPTIIAMQETHVNNKWKTGTLRKNFKALAEQIQ